MFSKKSCYFMLMLMVLWISVAGAVEDFTNTVINKAAEQRIRYSDVVDLDTENGSWISNGATPFVIHPYGGPDGTSYLTMGSGTKWGRSLAFVIKDNKATTGTQTFEFDVLYTMADGKVAFRVWGINDDDTPEWNGSIQGGGGAGNFGCESALNYGEIAGDTDATQLVNWLSRTGAIEASNDWQHAVVDVNMGEGYDWVVVGFANGFRSDVGSHEARFGLDNVVHPWTEAADPRKATNPSPSVPQELDVTEIVLGWKAGEGAASHNVYVGAADDLKLVSEAQGETTYKLTDFVAGTTVNWRVDEVQADGFVVEGTVWAFVIKDFLDFDNFESYESLDDTEWWDNLDSGMLTWNVVSDADKVYAGNKALELRWRNDGQIQWEFQWIEVKKFSETELRLDPPKDLTVSGASAIFLTWRGDTVRSDDVGPDEWAAKKMPSATDRVYVRVTDADDKISDPVFYGPATDIMQDYYHEFNVALSEFTNVDVTKITKIQFGVGDPMNPQDGGWGTIWLDEVRLYVPRRVPEKAKPAEDINGDCVVDQADLDILTENIGKGGMVAAIDPGTNGLVSYLKLDGNANCELGNPVTEELRPGTSYGPGLEGQSLVGDGLGSGASLGTEYGPAVLAPLTSFSSSTWINAVSSNYGWPRAWQMGNSSNGEYFAMLPFHSNGVPSGQGGVRFEAKQADNTLTPDGTGGNMTVNAPVGSTPEGEWCNIVTSLDAVNDTLHIYVNGKLVASSATMNRDPSIVQYWDQSLLGSSADNNPIMGSIDELKIFDRPLSQAEAISLAGLAEASSLAYGEEANSDLDGDGDVDADDQALLEAAMGTVVLWP